MKLCVFFFTNLPSFHVNKKLYSCQTRLIHKSLNINSADTRLHSKDCKLLRIKQLEGAPATIKWKTVKSNRNLELKKLSNEDTKVLRQPQELCESSLHRSYTPSRCQGSKTAEKLVDLTKLNERWVVSGE